MKPRLMAPHLTVVLADGATFEVQATNYDMLMYERESRTKRKLPDARDAPVEWATWIAWHALHREHLIVDMTHEEFTRAAISVDPGTHEDGRVDPTPPDPAAD